MRWLKKERDIIKRFAFVPTNVGGEFRWLETVYILRHSWIGTFGGVYWENDRFVTKELYSEYKKSGTLSDCEQLDGRYGLCEGRRCSVCKRYKSVYR